MSVFIGRGVESEYESPAKKRRYRKTNLDQCSGSWGGKRDGIYGRAASDSSAVFKEDEDVQYTHDCVLENIFSTLIL